MNRESNRSNRPAAVRGRLQPDTNLRAGATAIAATAAARDAYAKACVADGNHYFVYYGDTLDGMTSVVDCLER